MNREIEFRAWDKEYKKMIYDSMEFHLLLLKRAKGSDDHKSIIGFSEQFEGQIFNIMQYTGLKDKNGNKIFEGDIVKGTCSPNPRFVCQGLIECDKLGKELVGFIRYSETFAQYYFTTDDITFLDLKFGILNIKILGNIHENPELLEVK